MDRRRQAACAEIVPGDGVAGVVVIGVPDAKWGEAVTAFVVTADRAKLPALAPAD